MTNKEDPADEAYHARLASDEQPEELGASAGPTNKKGQPCCWECFRRDESLIPAEFIGMQQGRYVLWRFLCANDAADWSEPGEPSRPVLPLGPSSSATSGPAPEPFKMVFYGVCLAACVEGGPLDGHHLQVEVAGSEYPWRKHLIEGSRSGRPSVWNFPLHRPLAIRGDLASSKYVQQGPDVSDAGRFLGKPLRFTVEVDPEAKY